jgi:hypothetical protein
LLYKLGYNGSFSYWSANECLEDPWQQNWSGIAGSGVLLYPARPQDGDQPVNFIRCEMLCDGLEDVEYLQMLSSFLKQNRFDVQQSRQAQKLLFQTNDMIK